MPLGQSQSTISVRAGKYLRLLVRIQWLALTASLILIGIGIWIRQPFSTLGMALPLLAVWYWLRKETKAQSVRNAGMQAERDRLEALLNAANPGRTNPELDVTDKVEVISRGHPG